MQVGIGLVSPYSLERETVWRWSLGKEIPLLLLGKMTASGKSIITSPESYTSKDLLLLSQLLHTQGLIEPESVKEYEDLDGIGYDWFHHDSTQLLRRTHENSLTRPPAGDQILALYENMLAENPECKTTTDLANKYYFARVHELEHRIQKDKEDFKALLGET